MDDFRTFEGKSIDDAISQAMAYYDVARAQLEIDIICDAKAGIFGLVGARKAQVKARRRESARRQVEAMRAGVAEEAAPRQQETAAPAPASEPASRPSQRTAQESLRDETPSAPAADPAPAITAGSGEPPVVEASVADAEVSDDADEPASGRQGQEKSRRSRSRRSRKPAGNGSNGGAQASPVDGQAADADKADAPAPRAESRQTGSSSRSAPATLPDLSDEQAEAVKERVQLMMEQLLAPLVGEPVLQLSMPEPGKILVGVDAGEDAGLLIGKEGGTLAALQYLANRILAKQIDGPLPRLSLEAGNYKERQDDTLRQLALSLAEKAKSSGKAQSTRPLSSYHRRVIHVALQEDDTVVTRSKGEGSLKRVVILPKKAKRAQQVLDGAADESAMGAEPGVLATGNGDAPVAAGEAKPRRPRRPRRRRGQGEAPRPAGEQGAEAAAEGDTLPAAPEPAQPPVQEAEESRAEQ